MPTQGFQLSQFSRAPQVPGGIGDVDVKGIYDSVVNSLRAHEAMQATAGRQAETEATQLFNTQKANLGTQEALAAGPGVLDAAAATRNKNILSSAESTAELPLVSQTAADKAGVLRAKARAAEYSSRPEVMEAAARAKATTTAARTFDYLNNIANDPNQPPEVRDRARIALKDKQTADQEARARAAANKTVLTPLADGRVMESSPDGKGRWIVGEPETREGTFALGVPAATASVALPSFGAPGTAASMAPEGVAPVIPATATTPPASVVAPTVAPVTATPVAAPAPAPAAATPQVNRFAADKVGMAATEARNATNEALYKVASTRASEALPKDQNLIETMTAKNRAVDRAIDNAIHEVAENTWRTTGGSYAGQAARATNLWDATARFKNLLSQIEANIGFDTLQEMRNNSKTGGALGNISDAEGAQLKSVFGSLTQEMSPPDMIKALTVVKNARIEAIVRLQEQHKRAVELNNAELSRLRPDLHPPKTDAEHSAAAAEAKQPLALPPSGEKSLVTEEQRRRYQK